MLRIRIPDPESWFLPIPDPGSRIPDPGSGSATLHFFYKFGHWTQRGRGVTNREQRSSSRSRRGGVSENEIAVATAARLFFLTAVAIAIATRLFKFHEISVSNTSSSFVSSIHSFAPIPPKPNGTGNDEIPSNNNKLFLSKYLNSVSWFSLFKFTERSRIRLVILHSDSLFTLNSDQNYRTVNNFWGKQT